MAILLRGDYGVYLHLQTKMITQLTNVAFEYLAYVRLFSREVLMCYWSS